MEPPTNQGQENGGETQQSGPIYFGNYEAVKAIGKGKFAIVYRAHRIGDDQVVALKRISVDMMNDKAREKCLKEVRLLQSLDHPNIIRYMDSFINDNDLIIIYEWAAAGDLKRQIRKAQEKGAGFEERVIWKYFSQIANAIQFMHEKRIMHRDLKPANIFLTLDGTIKVGDLGLSREFSEHTHQAHSKVGTPLYMSPEVIKGVDGYDFKSDIWSLGCLLYELAVLKSPFKSEGINLYSLLHKISNGEYQPIPDHYSEELRNLAHAMISTSPDDRPDINYICEVAAQMRSQTATERGGKIKRSYSKSDDLLNDGIAEIKQEAKQPSGEERFMAAKAEPDRTEAKEWFAADRDGDRDRDREDDNRDNEDDHGNYPPRRRQFQQEKETDRGEEEEYPRSNVAAAAPRGTARHAPNNNNSNNYENVVLPVDEGPREKARPNQSGAVSEAAVYRRTKPPRSEGSAATAEREKQARPSSGKISRPTTVDEAKYQNNQPIRGESRDEGRDSLLSRERNNNANNNIDNNSNAVSDLSPQLENAYPAFALMDIVYGKLQLLEYPMTDGKVDQRVIPSRQRARGHLLPIHFAVNLQIFERIAGHEPNYQFQQFHRMIEVIQFLCLHKLRGKALETVNKIDLQVNNSMTIAKQLLLAAQAAGPLNEELAAISPTSLLPGYGYNVCLLLNHFADCALKAIDFTVKPMIYPGDLGPGLETGRSGGDNNSNELEEDEEIGEHQRKERKNNNNNNNNNILNSDEEDDQDGVNSLENNQDGTVNKEEESDLAFSLSTSTRAGGDRHGFHHGRRIIEATHIDPAAWRQETERIIPLLKKSEKSFEAAMLNSWQSHFQTIENYCHDRRSGGGEKKTPPAAAATTITTMRNEGNNNNAGSSAANSRERISEMLRGMKSELSNQLLQIQKAEKLVRSRQEFEALELQFRSHQQALEGYQSKASEMNTKNSELTSSLAEKEELLEDLKEALQAKVGGGKAGDDDAGNPVIRYKEAIQRLQDEIKEMFVASHYLNNQLLSKRKEGHYRRLELSKKQQKKRKKRAAKKTNKSEHRVSSLSSEEEDDDDDGPSDSRNYRK